MNALSELYKTDFYAWTEKTAELLRQGRFAELDSKDLAEEVDGMGAKERRELMSRLDVLVTHLFKWHFQSEQRSSGWDGTI